MPLTRGTEPDTIHDVQRMRARLRLRAHACACLMFALCSWGAAQAQTARVLDDFEQFSGWHPIVSEGARLTLTQAPGRTGQGMAMDFELVGVYGYVIAEKDFAIDLPANYQFTFEMKADIPVNNFEFKLIDEKENVFWIKKLNVDYPKQWEKQKIKKRHLSFAWGPSGGGEIHHVRKLQLVVSSGQGGKGRVLIDDLKFEPLDDPASAAAKGVFSASSSKPVPAYAIDEKGTLLTNWTSAGTDSEWIEIRYNFLKEIGGLVIDWDSTRYAEAYSVQISEDSLRWSTVYSVSEGNGGRDYLYLPEKDARMLRVIFTRSHDRLGYAIRRMEVKGPEFSMQPNDFFFAVAKDARRGLFPKYFLKEQSYWTVSGVNADVKEALMNEEGMIEADKEAFSLEPFLFINGKLVTWNDVQRTPSLEQGYYPIPSVEWKSDDWTLRVRLFSAGAAGSSVAIASYTLSNSGARELTGKLFIALRPFQVNPPWQWLNTLGGASHINSVRRDSGTISVDARRVIPMTKPDAFGAAAFDNGDITEYLAQGRVPSRDSVTDHTGFASAALEYSFSIPSGSSSEYHVAVPFHAWQGSPTANMSDGGGLYVRTAFDATMQFWRGELDRVKITLPAKAQAVVNTVKSNLAYILINRDGPGIQPGSRNYERSWIRDGSLTSTALLQLGVQQEVREYLDWYAQYQFPNGKVPCVVDGRGADPTPEHDSHGEFIYAIRTYFNFTRDTAWLRGKFDNVEKAVRYIQSLRAQRKADTYRNGTPEQRALFGILPESISHEGYSAMPRHSYWDDFFAIRGLKDAAEIARTLGIEDLSIEFARERDDFRKDLYASMRLAMKNNNISYIPGCAELGDFDATSTTIGVNPCGELGWIPEPQLHSTFDKYYSYFTQRKNHAVQWTNYTPYENRVIGTFVYLDQKDRAQEAMRYFMNDRRPAAWNEWAEVVWPERSAPKFIGDMPHTWVGSDFIRSVRAMFVYERESDSALVIGAGIPEEWVDDTTGVTAEALPTTYGPISYSMKKTGGAVTLRLSGPVRMLRGKIVVKSPLNAKVRSATVNGKKLRVTAGREITVWRLPAEVVLRY